MVPTESHPCLTWHKPDHFLVVLFLRDTENAQQNMATKKKEKNALSFLFFFDLTNNVLSSLTYFFVPFWLVVSKAFTVLSDPQKRAIFDQHGPEDGKSSGVNYDRASPMGAQGFGGGMHGMNGFGEEISPEELFNMFFGGGNFGGCKYPSSFAP